jgi:ribosome recycling factor
MNEDLQLYLDMADDAMQHAAHHLEESLVHIRAGKANVRILDGIRVEYYGSHVPLSNVSTITTPDARTITIQPFEKSLIKEIEKAIINSDVGIMPDNNGELIRLGIPPLTEDRRKQLAKQVHSEGEEARISVRNARREAIDEIKKLVKKGLSEDLGKDSEGSVQKVHDKYMKRIDEIVAAKEKEILTV